MEVNELYWAITAHTVDMLCIFIEAYFFCRFVKPFLLENKRVHYVGITYVIVNTFVYLIPVEVAGTFLSAIMSTVIFIVIYSIDKRNVEQKLFLSIICYLLGWEVSGMVIPVWNTAFDISLMIPAVRDSFRLQFVAYVINQIFYVILFFNIFRLFIKLLHKVYIYKRENMTKKELVLLLTPLASVISGRVVFKFFANVYEMDLKQYVWENHRWGYDLLLLVYQLISIALICTVIRIYQSIKAAQKKEKEEAVFARQLDDMKKHIGELESLYYDIRSLKHDMKNHVMVLENLCKGNEEAEKYVMRLKSQIDEGASKADIKSGNPITDIIIGEKQKEAGEKGIAFYQEFHYPQDTQLNAFDVSIILNNALNNAIEAAEECEDAFVKILSYHKRGAYMIEIRNSMTGQRVIDSDSGLPLTTKSGSGHGFGLANIRKVAQKYYGDIDIEQSEDEFGVVVMLMVKIETS